MFRVVVLNAKPLIISLNVTVLIKGLFWDFFAVSAKSVFFIEA